MNIDSPQYRLLCEQFARLPADTTIAVLQAFYANYKYLIMSRDLSCYREIGVLLANANKQDLSVLKQCLFDAMTKALAIPPTRGGNVNALLHISGYFKKQLSPEGRRSLRDCIERYARGEIELHEPVALLHLCLQRFPNAYLDRQVFLQNELNK